MPRYIDADELKEERDMAIKAYENANILNATAIREYIKPLLDKIVDLPTDDMRVPKRVDLTETSKVKAVDVETKEIRTYPVVRCPSCDKPMTLYKERKFCEKCGQALDWSDVE